MMNIKQLKKELGITNSDIALLFGLTPNAYANSTAKKRYECALIDFYAFVKGEKREENIKTDSFVVNHTQSDKKLCDIASVIKQRELFIAMIDKMNEKDWQECYNGFAGRVFDRISNK